MEYVLTAMLTLALINATDHTDSKQNVPNSIAGLQIEDNTKRNGGDYKNFTVANVEECAHTCARDSKCQSFNYGIDRRDCWLKHSVPDGVHNTTVISGVKEP